MFGIDVSHHQNPATMPWDTIAATSSFCIVRATYGAGLRDRHCAAHVRRARQVGLQVGLYHFYRPSQSPKDQILAFRAAAQAARYEPGDIIPALDIEADPIPKMQHVSPAWQEGVLRVLDAMVGDFGNAMVYITQREFVQLGKPPWILERPLWVAHYTGAAKPATPGNKPALIWQHRVGPYDPQGPGGYTDVKGTLQLDQNRSFGELPRSVRVPWGMVSPDARAFPSAPPIAADEDAGWDEATALALAAQAAVDAVQDDARAEMTGHEIDETESGGEA
jgi:lysozyme